MSAATPEIVQRLALDAPSEATRPWRDSSFVFVALFVVTLGALIVDDRLLNGISVWIKPLKFQASLAVHFATLVLLARLLPESRRHTTGFRTIVGVSTAAGLFEVAYIMLQAARGRASHFNNETALEAVMYGLMGIGALILVAAPFVMGLWLWREHGSTLRSDPLRLGATLGLVLSAVATVIMAGYLSMSGGHWVGDVTSDAGGLPVFGWSREAGDLRVAHFFASHGMQLLPLMAFTLRDRGIRGSLYVSLAAAGWLLFTAAVFVEAVLGRPFL